MKTEDIRVEKQATRQEWCIRSWYNRPWTHCIVFEDQKIREAICQLAMDGKWGNGGVRKSKLKAAGYDYSEVQKKVNELAKKEK